MPEDDEPQLVEADERAVGDAELLASVVSAADVARELAELRERFGAFPVRERERENDPERFASGVEKVLDGWRGDAGAFVADLDGRALLVRHADAPETWGTPGGGHEPGESFAETARRECREEAGVDPALVGVREAVRTRVVHAEDPERSFTMLTVHFEGNAGMAAPALDVGDDEIRDAEWFETAPDAVHEHCRDWLAEHLPVDVDAFGEDDRVDALPEDAALRKRFVDARVESLHERFGDFPESRDEMPADDDAFASWVRAGRADGRVGGGYCFVTRTPEEAPALSPSMGDDVDTSGERALLAMSRGEDSWTTPGGGVEPGESFDEAAEREVREETGVECRVEDVLAVCRGVGVHEDSGREVHFCYVVFDARYEGGSIDVQAGEMNGACWFREPPEPAHWLVDDHLDEWFDALDSAALRAANGSSGRSPRDDAESADDAGEGA